MASKSKETRQEQKTYWEKKLDQRLSVLSDKGLEPGKISKEASVKKIRAKIRKTGGRLKVINSLEMKVAEMARTKAEKLTGPKKEKVQKGEESEEISAESKRQQKKKRKMEGKSKN